MNAAHPLPELRVRPMRSTDLEAVLGIERMSFSSPWSRSSFRTLLARADADLWVAEVEGRTVGYAAVWYMAHEAELGNLAVSPAWRRRGIGGRLLERAIESARRRKARRLYLEVRDSNRSAQALYYAHGFVLLGRRRRYYRSPVEDARVMCLELDADTDDADA